MHWQVLLILVIVMATYILVGGAIFMALEQSNEDEINSNQSQTFTQFLTDHTCVTSAQLEAYAQSVIKAYDAGVISAGSTSSVSNWNYESSLFFSLTVVTSIGFGHISPATAGGQVFFIFYAIFGIPLMAIMLSGVAERLAKPYKKVEKAVCVPKHPKTERILKLLLFMVMFYTLLSLIPATVFMHIEDWTYLEAWYFTMVTLTTVGFGDFVPGQGSYDNRVIYKLMVMVWIILGLAWLSLCLTLIQDFIKGRANKIDQKITDVEEKKDEKNKAADDTKETDLSIPL